MKPTLIISILLLSISTFADQDGLTRTRETRIPSTELSSSESSDHGVDCEKSANDKPTNSSGLPTGPQSIIGQSHGY